LSRPKQDVKLLLSILLHTMELAHSVVYEKNSEYFTRWINELNSGDKLCNTRNTVLIEAGICAFKRAQEWGIKYQITSQLLDEIYLRSYRND